MGFQTPSDFENFCDHVRFSARHVLSQTDIEFLNNVAATSEKRRCRLPKGSKLFRAVRGYTTKKPRKEEVLASVLGIKRPAPYGPRRMVPLAERVSDGRANVRGIPCLYLAKELETAIHEVRPPIESYVSLAQVTTLQEFDLIDCTVDSAKPEPPEMTTVWGTGPDPATTVEMGWESESVEPQVWHEINEAFSTPIQSDDSYSVYVPTQILAELFKKHNYAGIIYQSRLFRKGTNIALFDYEGKVKIRTAGLYQISDLAYRFGKVKFGKL